MPMPDVILEKFAEAAFQLLTHQGEKFSTDDVVKVASFLLNVKEDRGKVAEFEDQGRVVARSFYAELNKMGGIGDKVVRTVAKVHGTVAEGVASVGEKLIGKVDNSTAKFLINPSARQRVGNFMLKKRQQLATGATVGAGLAAGTAGASLIND